MKHWYTADPHFGHKNILHYCDRPFENTDDMDAALLQNLQDCVMQDDHLWIIGDFYCGKKNKDAALLNALFNSIPGQKHLIIGNHDHSSVKRLPWASIHALFELSDGETKLVLCHYPLLSWNGDHHGSLHLFGHVHDKWQGTNKSINVGVDLWDYKPTDLEAIKQRAKTLPPLKLWGK
ncbi:metallophosphoesterase [Bartonella sp. HY038]|uniref:metallophosphoesterase n=1 Tax=Bartonella sp. HY038 TaxID=2759660 RepID=UPI0015F934B4|nr:metallophosphoesterase [Bartonella sp. HY038]